MSLLRAGSLLKAQVILDLLDKDDRLKRFEGTEDLYVKVFSNGREQGYSLILFNNDKKYPDCDLQISFAEQKSSDDLVVYSGKPVYSTTSEDFFLSGKYFRYNQHKEAVDYIIGLIESFIRG